MSISERLSFPSAEDIAFYLNTQHPFSAENTLLKQSKIVEILARSFANVTKPSMGIQTAIDLTLLDELSSWEVSERINLSMLLFKALKDCAKGEKFEVAVSSSTTSVEVKKEEIKVATPPEELKARAESEGEIKVRHATESLIDPTMTKIEKWESMAPFASRVVAFRTTSPYFGAKKGFSIDSDASLKFGYISDYITSYARGEAYNIKRLLKPTEVSELCALVNPRLDIPLLMRLATLEEVNKMRKAIQSAAAKFEYESDNNCIFAFLDAHISKL